MKKQEVRHECDRKCEKRKKKTKLENIIKEYKNRY